MFSLIFLPLALQKFPVKGSVSLQFPEPCGAPNFSSTVPVRLCSFWYLVLVSEFLVPIQSDLDLET